MVAFVSAFGACTSSPQKDESPAPTRVATSASREPRRRCPDRVIVDVEYPGAAVELVEHDIVVPLEAALQGLEGTHAIHAFVRAGRARLVVENTIDDGAIPTEPGAAKERLDRQLDATRDAIAAASSSLPDASVPPRVAILAGEERLLPVVVSGPLTPLQFLGWLDGFRRRLLGDPAVRGVDVIGAPARELVVRVDPRRLMAFGLGVSDVVATLQRFSLEYPRAIELSEPEAERVGELELSAGSRSVHLSGVEGSRSVRLSDVAELKQSVVPGPAVHIGDQQAVVVMVRTSSQGSDNGLADRIGQLAGDMPVGLVAIAAPAPIEISRCDVDAPTAAGPAAILEIDRDLTKAVVGALAPVGSPAHRVVIEGADVTDPDAEAGGITQVLEISRDDADARRVLKSWRLALAGLPNLGAWSVTPTGAQLTVELEHADPSALEDAAGRVRDRLATRPGVASIARRPADRTLIEAHVDRDRAGRLGVPVAEVLSLFSLARFGETIGHLGGGGDALALRVRLTDEPDDTAPEALLQMVLPMSDGRALRLGDVGALEVRRAPAEIHRHNHQRCVVLRIAADSDEAARDLVTLLDSTAIAELQAAIPGLTARLRP